MEKLVLEEMKFYAFHGLLPEERKIGGYYTVSVSISSDLGASVKSDNIEDTIDYKKVYDIIKKEMKVSSRLIEHVGGRIADAIIDNYSMVKLLVVKIKKHSPPVDGDLPAVSFILERDNYERNS